jgi:hypothetical protein
LPLVDAETSTVRAARARKAIVLITVPLVPTFNYESALVPHSQKGRDLHKGVIHSP